MPALPVIAKIFALVKSLFIEAKRFRKLISSFTRIVFFLYFFFNFEETIYFAPFFKASFMKSVPSFFFPLIVKNKLSFLIVLESIDIPLKFIIFLLFNNLLQNFDYFVKKFFLFL